jgi:hypothetical protein
VQPPAEPSLPSGPLILEEAVQAPNHAGYLPPLAIYFNRPIAGRCYHVYVDTGRRFLCSGPFFPWPADDAESIPLRIQDPYRQEFDELLRRLVSASSVHEALVLCECNGDVTWPDLTPEDVAAVRMYGPVDIQGFWALADAGAIVEPSITIIQEP